MKFGMHKPEIPAGPAADRGLAAILVAGAIPIAAVFLEGPGGEDPGGRGAEMLRRASADPFLWAVRGGSRR